MLMNAPCTLEDTDDVGAYSFAQRMRYEMDDVYIRKDVIELAPIDVSNVYAILKLSVDSKQQGFVAENALSLAEAVALEGKALPYAIVQNGVAVGSEATQRDITPEPCGSSVADSASCKSWRTTLPLSSRSTSRPIRFPVHSSAVILTAATTSYGGCACRCTAT